MSPVRKNLPNVFGDAHVSHDGVYRYELTRQWGSFDRQMIVIGLNPSTADASTDDPTIRRCVSFAKREGCGRLVMLNLFALRSTDPHVLRTHSNPIGPENDATLLAWASRSSYSTLVVAAWGAHVPGGFYAPHMGQGWRGYHRDHVVVQIFGGPEHVLCFGHTAKGHPRHPLYLASDTPLQPLLPNVVAAVPKERGIA